MREPLGGERPGHAQPGAAGPIGAFAIRLASLGGIFALALLVELRGSGEYTGREADALYGLVFAGLLQTVAQLLLGLRARGGPAVRGFEAMVDGLLVSALVYCAGGVESVFVFLYDVWIVHVAMRVGARAALLAGLAAAVSYGSISLGPVLGCIGPFEPLHGVAGFEHALYPVVIQSLGFALVASLSFAAAAQIQVGREELHELGELHRRIVDNVASGLLTSDRAGAITSFNREAERITGFGAAEVLGERIEMVFPHGSGIGVLEPRPSGGPRPVLEFTDRDGGTRHLGFSSSVLRSAQGEPDGAIVIFQDLTRVVEMEEQLRRSERLSAVGQLAAGLAHEIRNPLASLSGAIELLAADFRSEDGNSRRLLRIVGRETERLNRLVSGFLEYARAGPGRREAVGLRPLFEEMAQLLQGSEHRGIELRLDVPAAAAVRADPDRLRQVLWNLLLNAAESAPRDRRIEVSVRGQPPEPHGPPRVEIAVRDRGQGIAAEHVERVFEPFFTTKPKGTGLGLATVHRLIEASGGSVSLRSTPGEGTTVRIVLLDASDPPLRAAEPAAPAPA